MAFLSERRFISISNVKPGMVVQFRYTKLSGEVDNYIILVIDPIRTNAHARGPQLHGYDIRDMSDEEVFNFIASLRKAIQLDPEFRERSIVEDINSDDAYEAYMASMYKDKRPYRTFNLSSITQLRQVLISSPD